MNETETEIEIPDYPPYYSPDGLTEHAINLLLGEIARELAREQAPQPSAVLLDGTAAERRDRRIAQRALGATVRVLRVHGPLTTSSGSEAA